jgi:hypothetical protein
MARLSRFVWLGNHTAVWRIGRRVGGLLIAVESGVIGARTRIPCAPPTAGDGQHQTKRPASKHYRVRLKHWRSIPEIALEASARRALLSVNWVGFYTDDRVKQQAATKKRGAPYGRVHDRPRTPVGASGPRESGRGSCEAVIDRNARFGVSDLLLSAWTRVTQARVDSQEPKRKRLHRRSLSNDNAVTACQGCDRVPLRMLT